MYITHIIKFTHLKCILLSIFIKLCNHYHYLTPKHFHHPKKKPYTKQQSPSISSSPPGPWKLPVYSMLQLICPFWTFHVNGTIQYMVFCVWLLSLSMKFSRFVHVTAGISTSFLFMAEQQYTVWIYRILFIHASVGGHLGCFSFLAIINNAVMNMCTSFCMKRLIQC